MAPRCEAVADNGAEMSSKPAPPPPSASDRLLSLLDSTAVPDATMAKQLGLNEEYLQALMELPGTSSTRELKSRLVAMSQWNADLRRGILPKAGDVSWPQEPFRSKFLDVLKKLEMPRFTRRHPKLLASLMRQFLQLAKEFEGDLQEEEAHQQKQQQQQNKPSQAPQPSGNMGDQNSEQQEQQDGSSQDGKGSTKENPDGEAEEDGEAGVASGDRGQEGDIELKLDDMEAGQSGEPSGEGEETSQSGYAEKLAEELLQKFEQDWAPTMEAMEEATQAFDDIDSLLEGPDGFDNSASVWHSTGWREVASLRKKLETLRELRDLVRSLGRGGGKGPLKKAPEVVYRSGMPAGVIRSEESPEETRGLTRSGDLSRMLPLEAHLLAAGWPRQKGDGTSTGGSSGIAATGVSTSSAETGEADDEVEEGGSRACRLLFMARRAERMLMSYERAGWVEDQPSRVTGRLEIRPASELGPIIVCLDTSGSMHGAREVVAKALTLECMRGAHRQQRKCYVYAFSGPGDVMELELGMDHTSLPKLLNFLTMSFSGGTDVDAPLALSLERLRREEWGLADILMVTDGEIPSPDEDILRQLQIAREALGLEVHGLLVGRNVTEPMKELCTHLHVFKSWSAVGASDSYY